MSIGLINMISMQKALKTYLKIGLKIALFGYYSHPPNRHVASPLAMLKKIKGMQAMLLQKEYAVQKVCVQVRPYLQYKQIRPYSKTITREQIPYRNKF